MKFLQYPTLNSYLSCLNSYIIEDYHLLNDYALFAHLKRFVYSVCLKHMIIS